MAAPAQIDYNALADQARQSAPAAPVDYAALADQARKSTPVPPSSDSHPLDSAANAISNWWDQVHHGPLNLHDVGKGLAGMVMGESGPFETEKAMGQQTGRLWQKTKDAYNQGDYPATAFHLLNYALSGIPGVSSAIDDAGEQIKNGDVAGGVGKTLGVITNLGIGMKSPEIAEGAVKAAVNAPAQVGKAIETAKTAVQQSPLNPMRVNPTTAMVRGLRPPPTAGGFMEDIPATISTIKAANPGFKPEVSKSGELNLVPAANRAIDVYQDALQPWIDRAEGQTVSGEPIIKATQEGIDSLLPSEQKSARKPFGPNGLSLLDRAKQDYGTFTAQELRDRLALLNERLSPFYNKSATAQSTALADIPEAVLKRQRDAVADTLYKFLDPENEGAGPRAIQSRTGDLIALRDAALRRQNAIAAEQPLTPLGKFVDPLKGAVRAMLPGKATGSGIAFAEGSEGRSLPLIRRSFNAVSETPGANEIGSIPRPGPRQIEAPPDTSGPIGYNPASVVDSPYAPQQRLLPPAGTQIGVSGVTTPDIVGSSSRGQGTPQSLIEGSVAPDIAPGAVSRTTGIAAPSSVVSPGRPVEPPLNILPRGPGSIGPGGTVPVRSAEAARKLGDLFNESDARNPASAGQPSTESPAPGMVRMYRGQPGEHAPVAEAGKPGTQFTTDRDFAKYFSGGKPLLYVDVPEHVLNSLVKRPPGISPKVWENQAGRFLPESYANRAVRESPEEAPPRAPEAPPVNAGGIPLTPALATKIMSGQALSDADWAEIGSHAPPKPPVNPYR